MGPTTTEIVGSALRAAAEKAEEIMAAASPFSKTQYISRSYAIFTREGKMTAHGSGSRFLAGLLPLFVESVLELNPLHTISPGDFIVTNDPYTCGSSLPVILGVSPVYFSKRPLALVASACSYSDLGGSAPGGMPAQARDIFQEGLRFSPVRVFKRGIPNEGLFAVLSHNSRSGSNLSKGIKAQFWAVQTAEKILSGLAGKYGFEKLMRCMEEIIENSRRSIADRLQTLPERNLISSVSAGEEPGSGSPLIIKAAVKKCGDLLTVDFTGTSPQASGPVNSSLGTTLSSVYAAVGGALPEIPLNDGLFRSIKVNAPGDSLVNPSFPAPVSSPPVDAIQDAVCRCLAQIFTGATPTGSGGKAHFTVGGFNSAKDSFFCYSTHITGGEGAVFSRDGGSPAYLSHSASPQTSVERLEAACPVLVSKVRLVKDSGGAGEFRGGPAVVWSFTVLDSNTVVSAGTGAAAPPEGQKGGLQGSPPLITISSPGNGESFNTTGIYTGSPGINGIVTLRTAGGGGFGPPLERNPDRVRNDLLEGLVSPEAAGGIYGVVLAGTDLEVDVEATARLRGKG
ncbi:MAG: hypothetical protein JL50_03295 [Peptococcaceae bacterium BICA1-7]|nr:MAG: hypothetical protein JL50_03295 [Peptococcaceae bacterium BICA1-7]HBV97709.1 hydantoinase B/oxoprolinase family protein [Desulfotomaculum sp.]